MYKENKQYYSDEGFPMVDYRTKYTSARRMTPEENPYEIVDGYMVLKTRMTEEKFKIRAIAKHGDRYTYEQVKLCPKNSRKDVVIVTCYDHGDFNISVGDHLDGKGCPECKKAKVSTGEKRIAGYLQKLDIEYVQEKSFPGCINPKTCRKLRYDFYLPKYNLLIEFDGEQHFRPSWQFSQNRSQEELEAKFKYRQELDAVKNQFALDNDIPLLRIPFNRVKYTEEIIDRAIAHCKGLQEFTPVL